MEMCSNKSAAGQTLQFPFPSNLHDIKPKQPRREMKHTHHTMPLQLWLILPKKIDGPSPKQYHAFVWANCCKSDRFWNKSDAEKQHHRNLLSVRPLLSQKSSSPHPRTECSSMGDLRHNRVVCFHANAYVWKPEDIVQLSRMAIFSVRHHTSSVWRGEMTKRSIWNQNNVFKLLFFFFKYLSVTCGNRITIWWLSPSCVLVQIRFGH